MKRLPIVLLIALSLIKIDVIIAKENEQQKYAYITSLTGIFLRDKPSKSSNKILLIPFNDEVEVIKEDAIEVVDEIPASWYFVKYKNNKGYCTGLYLSFIKPKKYNANNSKILNDIIISSNEGKCYYNNKIYLNMSLTKCIEILGNPIDAGYQSGGIFIRYKNYSLGTDGGYLINNDKYEIDPTTYKTAKINQIVLFANDYKISFTDIIQIIGKPSKSPRPSMMDGKYYLSFGNSKYYITYIFDDINDYVKLITIQKN